MTQDIRTLLLERSVLTSIKQTTDVIVREPQPLVRVPTTGTSRRTMLKAMAGASAVSMAGFSSPADANIFGWVFRILLRVFRRGAMRAFRRALIRPIGVGARTSYARLATRILDGYVAVDMVRAFQGLDHRIIGVAEHVAQQAQEFGVDTLWIAGRPNRIQLDFINDSPDVIKKPTIYFEQANLETGEQFIRPHPLFYSRDWAPGSRATIPSKWMKPADLIPMTIAQSGPIAIRPFVNTSPDVIFDEILVQVVDPKDVQWRT